MLGFQFNFPVIGAIICGSILIIYFIHHWTLRLFPHIFDPCRTCWMNNCPRRKGHQCECCTGDGDIRGNVCSDGDTELINPIYFLPIGAFFIVAVGCACYGCYDLFYPQPEFADSIAGGVIACDISDCPIPDIHEQHKIDDKSYGFWSRKAWGLDSSAENSTTNAGDYSVLMMMPPPTFGEMGLGDAGGSGGIVSGGGGGSVGGGDGGDSGGGGGGNGGGCDGGDCGGGFGAGGGGGGGGAVGGD